MANIEYRLVANGGSFEIKKNGIRVFHAYQIEKCFAWFTSNSIANYYVGYNF